MNLQTDEHVTQTHNTPLVGWELKILASYESTKTTLRNINIRYEMLINIRERIASLYLD